MRKIILILAGIFFGGNSFSQDGQINGTICKMTIVDGDTIPFAWLPIVRIYDQKIFKNKRERNQYTKLVKDVKKAYPYAKIAGYRILEYNRIISAVADEKQRDIMLKEAEKNLVKEFEKDIRNMTMSQGRILIKLIDRETGDTSYEVIRELRGGLTAFFWQSLARLFGANLKSEYDPAGEDKMIEEIIWKIENGDL